jgi:hypothetical protein
MRRGLHSSLTGAARCRHSASTRAARLSQSGSSSHSSGRIEWSLFASHPGGSCSAPYPPAMLVRSQRDQPERAKRPHRHVRLDRSEVILYSAPFTCLWGPPCVCHPHLTPTSETTRPAINRSLRFWGVEDSQCSPLKRPTMSGRPPIVLPTMQLGFGGIGLQRFLTVTLQSVTGLTNGACSAIRRGRVIPHSRHWKALRQLTRAYY